MRLMLCLVVLLGWSTADAKSDAASNTRPTVPEDFAYGISLEVDGDGALYSLQLPEPVYQAVQQSDLADLRVFNSRSVAVPHMIRAPLQAAPLLSPTRLPHFALYGAVESVGRFPRVNVVTGTRGAIIDVSGAAASEKNPIVTAYLVDLSALETPPSALEFVWSEVSESFSTSLRIESSGDLKQWFTLTRDSVLARLNYNGYDVQRKFIELPELDANYLRLTWPAGGSGVTLESVTAVLDTQRAHRPRVWTRVIGQADKSVLQPDDMIFRCDSLGVLPVDRLQIHLPHLNTFANARIFSRSARQRQWELRHTGEFYRINVMNTELANDVIHLSTVTDRYWKISFDKREANWSDGLPVCEFGWLPHELLFLAQGDAPFKLAYGSAAVGATKDTQIKTLLETKTKNPEFFIKQAQVGSPLVLGGESRLSLRGHVSRGLWVIPLLGVSFIVLLAYYLKKRAERAKRQDREG